MENLAVYSHNANLQAKSGFFERISVALREKAAERRAINELNALSNRELDDLGISRADIATVVRQGR